MRSEKGWFKKGQSGNPKGRTPMDPELKALRIRRREDVEKIILKFYNLKKHQLEKIMKDEENTTFWERHIARIILKGVFKGEYQSFSFLSDYIFGKRPETIQVSSISRNIQTDMSISELVKNPEIIEELIQLETKLRTLSTPSE